MRSNAGRPFSPLVMIWPALLAVLPLGCRSEPPPAEEAISRTVAEKFLAELRSGQAEAAWRSTTAEFKSDEGRESFLRLVREQPLLRGPLTFEKHHITELNGLSRAECRFQPPPALAGQRSAMAVRIAVGQEHGVWKVEGVFVEPAP